MTDEQIKRLLALGNDWQVPNRHRIYFDDLSALLGLRTWHYNTGNIRYAEYRGETVSNSEARRLIDRLEDATLWYDYATDHFHGRGLTQEEFTEMAALLRRVAAGDPGVDVEALRRAHVNA